MNTKTLTKSALTLALITGSVVDAPSVLCADEDGIIKIRLSYKIILNPKDHSRPSLKTRVEEKVSNEMIQEAVDEMNALMASYWRGYRFELYEIQEIGALGGFYPDPGHWFDIDFVEEDKQGKQMNLMQATIRSYATHYAWQDQAVNIYINQATSGGKWSARDLIVIGADSASAGWVHLHELGHYFDLRHTQGGTGVITRSRRGEGYTAPGDDNVDDTLKDLPGWSRDEIARHNFSLAYEELAPAQKETVDDVAENIMSYHFQKPVRASLQRLTEGQLDRWTDTTLDFYRLKVRDGRTWFVDRQTPGNEGTSLYPCDSVKLAVAAANRTGGDIILLRPGVYPEAVTINKPVTLRATRKGPASIGAAIVLAEMPDD
jgi:hypothetical protein